MPRKKVVQNPVPFRVESGGDVGIALQIRYEMVAPEDPGFDLFDEHQLARVKAELIALSENRFTFTFEPHPLKQWCRVFAESK